jgi:predicted phage tail protein
VSDILSVGRKCAEFMREATTRDGWIETVDDLCDEVESLRTQLADATRKLEEANENKKNTLVSVRDLEPDGRGQSYYASNDWISGYEAGFESAKDLAINAIEQGNGKYGGA